MDWWLANRKTCVLKARQLGVTWLASGLALWYLLCKPGTRVLAVSITDKDAQKVLAKTWGQLKSLPDYLRFGVEVVKPSRGAEPSDTIELRHPDGRLSTMLSLTSTPKAGHGETGALVILDEFARQEYARETWKAVLPTASKDGRILVISTGNGIATGETEGNFFHHVYTNAEALGVEARFLRWDASPDRDDDWYAREAMALPAADRGEQYPRDEDEAFILTGDPYFDREALQHYRKYLVEPELRATWEPRADGRTAKLDERDKGLVRVYSKPEPDRKYAIGVDTATGRGQDNSSAYVVDLSNLEIAAEIHGKLDPDIYAEQIHFTGKYYNTALIGVEDAGGFGTPVIIFLRDGKEGRPPYPNLYRHRQEVRLDRLTHKAIGFPMNSKTRPLVIGYLEKLLREQALPALTTDLLSEMSTFVHRTTNPSPRAQDGCRDDRVMSFALACELYRQRGEHPNAHRPRPRRRPRKPMYPWEKRAA